MNPGMLVTLTAPASAVGMGATEPSGRLAGSWAKAADARMSRLPLGGVKVGMKVGINDGHVVPGGSPMNPKT